MDPELLRDREQFKKRAIFNPVVEVSKKKETHNAPPKKKPKSSSNSLLSKLKADPFGYKTKTGFQNNFSILAKIVKHMKKRHQDGDTHPLNLEEILDETNQLDISSKQKHWLATEALQNNPKLQTTPDGKGYFFKPVYNLKDKKSLIRLLDKHDQRALGGVLLEDVEESLPNAERIVRNLGDQLTIIVRPNDKKKILFYNDKSLQLPEPLIDVIPKHWRSTAIGGIEDQKIEEYLNNIGITTIQEVKNKPSVPVQKRKKPSAAKRRSKKFKVHNDHMEGILEDYN